MMEIPRCREIEESELVGSKLAKGNLKVNGNVKYEGGDRKG